MNQNREEPPIFVWRDWVDERYFSLAHWKQTLECIYCGAALSDGASEISAEKSNAIDTAEYSEASCLSCGWAKRRWKSWHTQMPSINSGRWATQRCLRQFALSDPRIALTELGSHLRRNFSDIYSVSPRRFEELVAEVFRNLGWSASLTKATRDGGVDIYLLEGPEKQTAIVECKRQRGRIGIGIVDRLLGVQLVTGQTTAYLVTTSEFTHLAKERANAPTLAASGFQLNLVDAEELARMLGVFNEALPPLHLSRPRR